tara:strand:- start:149 stop:268 length:120 start_codon:yes stop_codon:yes gene_type:complete
MRNKEDINMKYELGKNKGMPSELPLVKRPELTEQKEQQW